MPQAQASPWGFTHPAANRHAQLQGVTVSYRFERSRRKSIGFLVGADGLVVRSPNWVTMREVDAAVQEKGAWIVAKLQQFKERQTEHFWDARCSCVCLSAVWGACLDKTWHPSRCCP
jgi:hypothetical protein